MRDDPRSQWSMGLERKWKLIHYKLFTALPYFLFYSSIPTPTLVPSDSREKALREQTEELGHIPQQWGRQDAGLATAKQAILVFLKGRERGLAAVVQLVGASSHKPRGHRFDFQSGHIVGLQVQSPGQTLEATDWRFSPSPPPSFPLSLISMGISSDEDKKRVGGV